MSLLPSSAQPVYFSLQPWQLKSQQSRSNQTRTIGDDVPAGKSPSRQQDPIDERLVLASYMPLSRRHLILTNRFA
jgi:hypothetical protein